MAKSYWITLTSASDLADKVALINSEQSALISALGITINYDTANHLLNISRTAEDNPFTVGMITIDYYQFADGDYTIGGGVSSVGVYANIICTANTLFLGFFSSLAPTNGTKGWCFISKNNDGTVTLVSMKPSTGSASTSGSGIIVKEGHLTSSSDPVLTYGSSSLAASANGAEQFALANIPRISNGNVCDNVFIVLAATQSIYSGLISINDVDYAVATCVLASTGGVLLAAK